MLDSRIRCIDKSAGRGAMDGVDPERNHTEPPNVPAFFSPEDLPSWLQEDGNVAALLARETRARAAWAVTTRTSAPRETPFGAAADATWSMLTPPQGHVK